MSRKFKIYWALFFLQLAGIFTASISDIWWLSFCASICVLIAATIIDGVLTP
jgi:hypothetical protein